MAKLIYRGPAHCEPRTISDKTVAGAYLPGTAVIIGATTLVQATAPGGRIGLLSNREFYDQSALTAYASGDTGVAYRLEPEAEFQWAMAAATYTFGQELTIGAAGRLVAAASGNTVVAFFDQPGAVIAAGALCDVVIANQYTKA
jgi:hypothetical protein